MITDKTLKVLGVVAAVLVVLSAWVGSRRPTATFEFNKGQLLVADPDTDRIDVIKVHKGEDQVELRRSGKGFVVASRQNYPASTREVNTLMRSVLGVRCAAEVSDAADAHAELGVVEDGDASTTVRFLDAEGKELVGVVVSDSQDGQQYVRLVGEDVVYRTEDFVSLRTEDLDFVDKKLVELPRDDVETVAVAPAEGDDYTILSPEKGEVELASVPDGKKAKASEPSTVFGAVNYVNFTDFRSESELTDLEFANRYTAKTRDGAIYNFSLAKQDETWWIRGAAEYVGPWPLKVPPPLPDDASDEDKQKNQEVLDQNVRWKDAREAVDAFNDRHQSWVYEIGSWKAESMTKPLDQLVEDDDGKPEKVSASHILIPYAGAANAAEDVTRTKDEARALAEDLHAQVVAEPSKFAELAQEHSSCPSAAEGGDLGEFSFETMSKPFSEAAFALEVGAISDVVETEFGFHVIQRTQ